MSIDRFTARLALELAGPRTLARAGPGARRRLQRHRGRVPRRALLGAVRRAHPIRRSHGREVRDGRRRPARLQAGRGHARAARRRPPDLLQRARGHRERRAQHRRRVRHGVGQRPDARARVRRVGQPELDAADARGRRREPGRPAIPPRCPGCPSSTAAPTARCSARTWCSWPTGACSRRAAPTTTASPASTRSRTASPSSRGCATRASSTATATSGRRPAA